jgi:NADPH:quinone reductase-like Zn-dependent oxidoreductase
MKAILQEKYGPPDVLELKEVETPVPASDEVLVRVRAAAVNIGDYFVMKGEPRMMRATFGLGKPRNPVGSDIAGVVEAAGEQVTRFEQGDEVFGWCKAAFAEYATTNEGNLVPKPAGLSFEKAAAVGVSAQTALQAVRDHGKVGEGQRVLVNGASGGVGTFAVQIAKAMGAEVTGVCSTRNLEMVRSIGADHVVDYTQEDFTEGERGYDVIIDIVANHSLSEYKRVLAPDGVVVPVGALAKMDTPLRPVLQSATRSLYSRQQGRPFVQMPKLEDQVALKELIESGEVVPVIDSSYPLRETAEAMRRVGSGRVAGKVVIAIGQGED